jgi:autotransporter translocation and assembly factor TamB
MKMAQVSYLGLAGLAVLVVATGASISPVAAACSPQAQSLIKNLNGAWRGSGTVKPIGGAEERISCRVNYVGATGRVSQKISCAGTDYKFEASAEVNCEGDAVSGTWTEKVANNTGSVNGSISGDRLNIDVDGPNFKGRFNVKVTGPSKHSLTITQFDPAAGRAVPVATVALSR